MRLFIALPVAEEIMDEMASLMQGLKKTRADVKWVERENIHLTVKFLGEVDPEMVPAIKEALKQVATIPPLRFSTRSFGFFPNASHPRVVWIGVGGEVERAMRLGTDVDKVLAPLGFLPEKNRKYHLTLGRVRSERNLEQMRAALKDMAGRVQNKEWVSPEALLIESELSRRGPNYRIVDRFLFSG